MKIDKASCCLDVAVVSVSVFKLCHNNCDSVCGSAVLQGVPALGEFVLVLHGVLTVQVFGSLLFLLGLLGLIKVIVFLSNH